MSDTEEPKKKTRRKKGDAMNDGDFQELVFTRCSEAVDYIEQNIAPERERATEYYRGNLPDVDVDDTEDDRSTAVLTEVRDTVLGMMPNLLRIFFSADGVCKYQPVPAEDPTEYEKRAAEARQATDYVQHVVLKQDNPDFFIDMHSAFQDGAVRKVGFVKAWWEKSKKPTYTTHTGLSEDMVAVLVADPEVTVTSKRVNVVEAAVGGPAVTYDVKIKRVCDYGKVRIKAVPCENVFVSQSASNIKDAPVFGYSETKPLSWFIEQGYTEAELEDCDMDPDEKDGPESRARRDDVPADEDDGDVDPAQRPIKYSEVYVLADKDGDGISELLRCECAGTKFKVLKAEPHDETGYACFSTYPEAHNFFGQSVADLTMDIQRINSRILRDTLDSLAQAVKPQMTVVEGQVNLDDVLNPDTSNVIRQRAPGMVQHLVTPFAGREALPVLEMMKNVREARTGVSDASMGLDPKVLQSTDKGAVSATLSGAQSRIEMVARIFAEMGMKRLFSIILKLIVANQDQARMVELRGQFVSVDPRSWNADMNVEPDVPLGRGSPQEQIGFLMQVLAKQEQIIGMLGPNNPVCNITQYRYTLAKILELAGWLNAGSFFGDPSKMTPEDLQKLEGSMKQAAGGGAQAGPAAPDPQVEMAKIKSAETVKMAELEFKRQELATNTQIESMKINADMHMRAMEIQATHATTLSAEQMKGQVKLASDQLKAHTAIIVEKLKPRGGGDKGASKDGGE